MPKLGMEPIRRRQLIDATIVSIGRYGLADTTVQRISREAGVSSGIIHHYFGGKNELLEATMRRLLQRLHDDVVTALAPARTAEERLIAVIESNFAASQFQAGVISAWLAFWAEAPRVPALGRPGARSAASRAPMKRMSSAPSPRRRRVSQSGRR